MSLLKMRSLPYTRTNVGPGLPEDVDIRPLRIGNGTVYIQEGIIENMRAYAEDNMLRVTVYFKNPFITR